MAFHVSYGCEALQKNNILRHVLVSRRLFNESLRFVKIHHWKDDKESNCTRLINYWYSRVFNVKCIYHYPFWICTMPQFYLRYFVFCQLSEMGGIPEGISDVWEMTGSRSNCEFTWDLLLNTNKKCDSYHKPRYRFDRIYLRDSDPKSVSPVYFELVGLEKLRVYEVFPSDHFGLLTHFDIRCC